MGKKKTISKEDFLEYLKSEKGKSRHQVEKAALNDPFLDEAMEGFQDMKNSIQEISQLDERIRPTSNVRMYGFVASLLLLLGLSLIWVVSLNRDTATIALTDTSAKDSGKLALDSAQISLENPSEKFELNTETPSDAKITLQKKEENNTSPKVESTVEDVLAKDTELLKPDFKPAEANNKEEETTFSDDRSFDKNISKSTLGEEISDEAKGVAPSTAPTAVRKEIDVSRRIDSKKNLNYKKSKSSKKAYSPRLADAASESAPAKPQDNKQVMIEKYNNKDYKRSLSICEKLLLDTPLDQELVYYKGLNEVGIGDNTAAFETLSKVTKNSTFYFSARWKMYELVSSDPVKSKPILEEIASEPNDFQEKAKALLK